MNQRQHIPQQLLLKAVADTYRLKGIERRELLSREKAPLMIRWLVGDFDFENIRREDFSALR